MKKKAQKMLFDVFWAIGRLFFQTQDNNETMGEGNEMTGEENKKPGEGNEMMGGREME